MSNRFRNRLIQHIEMNGPLPLAEFMHWSMADREQGYYTTRDPIGEKGDFTTAPEISQMFGELIGIWAMSAWQKLGEPEKFNLVEIGPGRGTLMNDLLRAVAAMPPFINGARVILVETSDRLAEGQRQALAKAENLSWVKSIRDIPDGPTIILANELLDVLPIRSYVKSGNNWHERAIGLNKSGGLTWVMSPNCISLSDLPVGHDREPDGSVFEISNAREAFVDLTAQHLKKNHGVALFIDYGHLQTGFGDTFQAVRNHQFLDPLEHPAEADLTSHVDFDALSKVASAAGMHVYPILSQGEFLLQLGLLERAGTLGAGQTKDVQQSIKAAAERLALPNKMGDLFKCFAFSDQEIPLVPFNKAAREITR